MSWASGVCWPPLASDKQGLITQWLALNPSQAERVAQWYGPNVTNPARFILASYSTERLRKLVTDARARAIPAPIEHPARLPTVRGRRAGPASNTATPEGHKQW